MILRYPVENLEGLKVEIYKNLREDKWSVRAREGEFKGKVIAYADEILLGGEEWVAFKVNEKGRERVNKNKRKEVHAVVQGRIITMDSSVFKKEIGVYYDPYKVKFFQNRETGEELRDIYPFVKFGSDGKVKLLRLG